MDAIYLLVATLATLIGAVSGFGGGVIIKPVLDALGGYNSYVISILSSSTVLSMAAVASLINLSSKSKFDKKVFYLVFGAVIGGILGRLLFSVVSQSFLSSKTEIVQAAIIIVLLTFVLFKNKLPKFKIQSLFLSLLAGAVLGSLSSFLGVGGGPFNVALLILLFSMDIKTASSASVLIIVFSQLTNLVTTAAATGFGGHDYSMLIYMIPGGIIGGFIGSKIKKRIPPKAIEKLYFVITLGLIALNIFNMFSSVSFVHLSR